MPDRRTCNRKHLIFYLNVLETDADRWQGQLVDISSSGLKLNSSRPFDVGKSYPLSIVLPQECFEDRYMKITAECVWCQPDIRPDQYVSGFRITDMEMLNDLSIEDIIDALFREYVFES